MWWKGFKNLIVLFLLLIWRGVSPQLFMWNFHTDNRLSVLGRCGCNSLCLALMLWGAVRHCMNWHTHLTGYTKKVWLRTDRGKINLSVLISQCNSTLFQFFVFFYVSFTIRFSKCQLRFPTHMLFLLVAVLHHTVNLFANRHKMPRGRRKKEHVVGHVSHLLHKTDQLCWLLPFRKNFKKLLPAKVALYANDAERNVCRKLLIM